MTKIKNIQTAYDHLKTIIKWRIENPDGDFTKMNIVYDTNLFAGNVLGDYIHKNQLNHAETLILLLALSPHLYPTLIKEIAADNDDAIFFIYAQIRSDQVNADPTGETVQYLLGGSDIGARFEANFFLSAQHFFETLRILYVGRVEKGEPAMRGKLLMYSDAFHEIMFGEVPKPKLTEEFPAHEISTELSWEDLILPTETLQHIHGIQTWLQHNETLMNELGMKKKLKPGYRVLFYGPPGTGKTLAASLLGKHIGRPVFRIDLSVLVSKYIGETEKHLANLFNRAKDKNWILFFDEADSVFGKRTNVRDSHDKYANQEVSYLLQKIETYSGMVILASNYKDNMDEAFMRRFQSVVRFELPKAKERLKIWRHNIPEQLHIEPNIILEEIANKHVLNGSNIMNIIQDVSLKALANSDRIITRDLLLGSIKREYYKEDKVFKE